MPDINQFQQGFNGATGTNGLANAMQNLKKYLGIGVKSPTIVDPNDPDEQDKQAKLQALQQMMNSNGNN